MARTVVGPPAVVAYALTEASNWWDQINESPAWQDRIFHVLAALYGVVAVVALVAPCPSRGYRQKVVMFSFFSSLIFVLLWIHGDRFFCSLSVHLVTLG